MNISKYNIDMKDKLSAHSSLVATVQRVLCNRFCRVEVRIDQYWRQCLQCTFNDISKLVLTICKKIK